MPTYQYRCTECGSDLDAVQKFTDPALTECPECEGVLRKVFSAVGVVFKGSGFYATDNRTKGNASASKAGDGKSESGKSDSAASDAGAASTSDAGKSEPKSASKPAPTGDSSKSAPVSAA